mmetsp:Transcript_76408/g.171405  ORF Transcript_76408/g.171405 Transcript_76408/m.171405 type:complete len:227 (+) Transcript_76408:1-681(+)
MTHTLLIPSAIPQRWLRCLGRPDRGVCATYAVAAGDEEAQARREVLAVALIVEAESHELIAPDDERATPLVQEGPYGGEDVPLLQLVGGGDSLYVLQENATPSLIDIKHEVGELVVQRRLWEEHGAVVEQHLYADAPEQRSDEGGQRLLHKEAVVLRRNCVTQRPLRERPAFVAKDPAHRVDDSLFPLRASLPSGPVARAATDAVLLRARHNTSGCLDEGGDDGST